MVTLRLQPQSTTLEGTTLLMTTASPLYLIAVKLRTKIKSGGLKTIFSRNAKKNIPSLATLMK